MIVGMLRTDDWLRTGLAVLARDGETGLRIDRMARELGVTKGSFHHHFAGATDFRRALLAHHRTEQLQLLDTAREATAGLPGESAIHALAPLATEQIDLPRERALRAWAVSDPEAAATVSQIDEARLALLVELWERELPPDEARTAALVPHLALIGGIAAGRGAHDMQEVFALLTVTTSAVLADHRSRR